jgi:pimeloyl-ACP methyl ester carboxylesterase
MNRNLTPMNHKNKDLYFEGATCSERMIQVTDQVKLRVLSFAPAYESGNDAIVFVGGLSTIIDSFRHIIHELTRDFPFYFIETRDHSSSQIQGEVQYDIQTSGLDIARIIDVLGLEDNKFTLMGYSLGATIIAGAYSLLKSKPRHMILMEPSPAFHYPSWGLRLMRASINLKTKPLKPVANWYIRNFVIDKNADAEMVKISANALNSADPVKLKKTILAVVDYTVWDKLGEIECPVLMLAASKDKFHVHEEITKMVSLLKRCTYIDLENNLRSHSVEAAEVIRNYVK